MISFKGKHYPQDIILYAVFFYFRYAVSYHDLEEIMKERGVDVDHATEAFFQQAVGNNGVPEKVVIDKSGANQAGLLNVNTLLWFLGFWPLIDACRSNDPKKAVWTKRPLALQTIRGSCWIIASRS